MKILVTYWGKVTCRLENGNIVVDLFEQPAGDEIIAEISPENASKYGLDVDDCFYAKVIENDAGESTLEIEVIVPRELTPEELAEISREVDASLWGIDCDKI
jgi:hypothetical protein